MKVKLSQALRIGMLGVSLSLGFNAMSHHEATGTTATADGKVYYKMPTTQEIVKRSVQMKVPAHGKGDLFLVAGDVEIKADSFFHKEHNGRVLFYVIFKNPPHSPANTIKVFRGTYVRGTNLAVYDGEVFARTYSSERAMSFISTKDIFELKNLDKVPTKFTYQAGFFFKAVVTPKETPAEQDLLFEME